MPSGKGNGRAKDLRSELKGVVLIGLAILSFASLIADRQPVMISSHGGEQVNIAVGKIGSLLSHSLKGISGGIGAYILPLFLLLWGVHTVAGRGKMHLNIRSVGALIFYGTGLAIAHMINPNYLLPESSHPDLLRTISVAAAGNGGGIVGAILAVLFISLFGTIGSFIFCGIMVIIALTMVMEIPIGDVLEQIWSHLKLLFSKLWNRNDEAEDGPVVKKRVKADRKRRDEIVEANDLHEDIDDELSSFDNDKQFNNSLGNSAPKNATSPIAAELPETDSTIDITDAGAARQDKHHSVKDIEDIGFNPEQLKLLSVGLAYQMPSLELLSRPSIKMSSKRNIPDQSDLLTRALDSFGISASVVGMDRGPHVTRYEIQMAAGIKYSKISVLEDDIALALAAYDVRIAPIHGTGNIGIEVANKEVTMVHLREVFESDEFQKASGKLTIGLGKDIAGQTVTADLAKMVHTLVSGATGSGKSVCVNTLITSLLFRTRPDEVKLLMIDPKVVELSVYNDIPHLISPVITDPRQAAASLKWAVVEMERRYKLFAKAGVRHLDSFNQMREQKEELRTIAEEAGYTSSIPYIVVIVDELADLMMVAPDDVEDSICRLAQKARAAGIHLVLATQRPSTDVITGLIKANIPSRIAFAVSSSVDSRVILDTNGAERLLGKGDMLYLPMGANKCKRVQGAFVSDREVEKIVEFVKNQAQPEYQENLFSVELEESDREDEEQDDGDELLKDAVRIILDTQHASASMLQRKLSIGYARAARLIDIMENKGMVGPHQGSKPREILITSKHLEDLGS